jgi:hypothetical protein
VSKDNTNLLKIPVTFEKSEEVDERFMEVKIWLMHLEENYNNSYFSKEVVEKAIPTLANTPILGYIETNSDGDEDFSDHRQVLVKEDGKYKVKYIGQAYGVIPETNDAKFEKRIGSDGKEREYLTVKGIMWKKWDDPIDIMDEDETKGQSMELSEKYDGEFSEDDGLFHFSDFKFFGACILGDGVQPAMEGATVEKQFSLDKMQEEIQSKMEEYKLLAMQKREVLHSKEDIEQDEVKKEFTTEGGNKMSAKEDEVKTEFGLSAIQLSSELERIMQSDFEEDDWGWKKYNLYYVDHSENLVFAQSRKDEFRLVGFEYSMNGDKPEVNFDSKKVFKIEYVPVSEGEEINFSFKSEELAQYEMQVKEKELEVKFTKEKEEAIGQAEVSFSQERDQLESLRSEVEELRTFKSTKIHEERVNAETEMFNNFSKVLDKDDEDFGKLKESASTFEKLEDLERELFALVGKKKANFSTKTSKTVESIKIPVEQEKQDETPVYGGLFTKFGISKK